MEIYTIGHSTHTIAELIELLKAHGIEILVDVRSIPKSRHCPQFNQTRLKSSLKKAKIRYRHLKDLGGLRHTTKDSINIGWHNASFRGFADYMQTESFEKGLKKLESLAEKHPCCIMCAEAVPWRCHRSLIADALTVRKWKVFHIYSLTSAKKHKLTPFLKWEKGMLIYPE